MASWNVDAETLHPLDYRLVQNSFVTMFWRDSVLTEALGWLADHDYDIVTMNASSWRSADDMFDAMAHGLNFPEYFGRNLNALNDCMMDVASGDYVDIIAVQARTAILIGNRILCLLQSSDPMLSLAPAGATPVMWNDAEWPDTSRGL